MAQASSGSLPPFLQDRRVQFGLLGVLAVIIIGAIVFVVMGNQSGDAGTGVEVATGMPGATNAPLGMEATDANAPAGTSDMPGGMPVADPGMPGAMPGAMPGMAPTGAAPGATEKPAKGLPKAVASRSNPFAPNTEMQQVVDSIFTVTANPDYALAHDIYNELNPPKPQVVGEGEEEGGPPVPPMRVAGVMMGAQVSAIMQVGSEHFQVIPGKMIPESNPVYRVERIEQDKVHLTRRWEMGTRKGTQKIEVLVAGSSTPVNYGPVAGPGMRPGGSGSGPGGNGPGR
jgi:hypothetical protein